MRLFDCISNVLLNLNYRCRLGEYNSGFEIVFLYKAISIRSTAIIVLIN